MSLLQRVVKSLGRLGLVLALPAALVAQTNSGYQISGVEYTPAGLLPGDQIYPDVALNANGGFMVWEDNITDGNNGYGVSALKLDHNLSAVFPIISPVNLSMNGDNENPRVALLPGGGAVIVWQGGPQGAQHIYAAFLSSSNTFIARDVPVSVSTNNYQQNPAVAVLAGGNVVFTWQSYLQDGDMFGVYAREFSPSGQPLGGEMLVNLTTAFNQRNPAIAALAGGGFVIAWVSEQQRYTISQFVQTANAQVGEPAATNTTGTASVDVYLRLYDTNASPTSGEILANTASEPCGNPAVAGGSDGTFIASWSQKDLVVSNNDWDVYMRPFSSAGSGGAVQLVNSYQYGEQYGPRIAAYGTDYLIVYTSLGQDGSRNGVFGQFFHGGTPAGDGFQVNTTTLNDQEYPSVASDGNGRFLAVWSSLTGLGTGMDVFAQRYNTYLAPLAAPAAPTVSALASYALSVTWPQISGMGITYWDLYVDGSATPIELTTNFWQNESIEEDTNDYDPGSTHTFQLAYNVVDGRESPLSPVATGKTWKDVRNGFDLPPDWETLYYGASQSNWKNSDYVLAPGVTVGDVFEWGANPLQPSTWLTVTLAHQSNGWYLSWNTIPGYLYQVETASSMVTPNWVPYGGSRYASGNTDSIFLGLSDSAFFRVVRVTY
jgi:hypothetical protein